MKRNWELIRQILIHIEEQPELGVSIFARNFPDFSEDEVNYHIWILIQSGLIIGSCNSDAPMQKGFRCHATVMTWQGQEFLSAVRKDTSWQKIRQHLSDKSVDISFEAIKLSAGLLMGTI